MSAGFSVLQEHQTGTHCPPASSQLTLCMQSELRKIGAALAAMQEQMQATLAWQSKALNMPFLAERRLLMQESSSEVGQHNLVERRVLYTRAAAVGWCRPVQCCFTS